LIRGDESVRQVCALLRAKQNRLDFATVIGGKLERGGRFS
jgi:hypothetical protein